MANCIAICEGIDGAKVKKAQRLGSKAARAEANTYHTFASAYVNADGSGYVEVKQHGVTICRFDFEAE